MQLDYPPVHCFKVSVVNKYVPWRHLGFKECGCCSVNFLDQNISV